MLRGSLERSSVDPSSSSRSSQSSNVCAQDGSQRQAKKGAGISERQDDAECGLEALIELGCRSASRLPNYLQPGGKRSRGGVSPRDSTPTERTPFSSDAPQPGGPPTECAVCGDEVLAQSHEIEALKRSFVYHLHAGSLGFEGPCVLSSPANVVAENENV